MAAEYHEFTGTVQNIEHTDNGPIKFGLGYTNGQYNNEKKFQVWPTDYKTKEVNPVAQEIIDLEGSTITVRYTTKQQEWNGKTFPKNTVWEVLSTAGKGVADSPPAASSSPSSSVVDYIDGLADDLKVAVNELRKGAAPAATTPKNPTAIPFFQAMDKKGFSKTALDSMAESKFNVHEYVYLTNDQLDEIAQGAGVEFSSKEPANF